MKIFRWLLLVIIPVVLVLSLCGCKKPPSVEEARSRLEDAGYHVVVKNGAEYADSDDNPYVGLTGLETYLEATKGDEKIQIFWFFSVDSASNNFDFMNSDLPKKGQNNHVVYLGTKQAVKDVKLE